MNSVVEESMKSPCVTVIRDAVYDGALYNAVSESLRKDSVDGRSDVQQKDEFGERVMEKLVNQGGAPQLYAVRGGGPGSSVVPFVDACQVIPGKQVVLLLWIGIVKRVMGKTANAVLGGRGRSGGVPVSVAGACQCHFG